MSESNESMCLKEKQKQILYMNVYSSIIHNRQEVKKVQMSLHTLYGFANPA